MNDEKDITLISDWFRNSKPCDLRDVLTIERLFKPDTASGSLIAKGTVVVPGLRPLSVIVKFTIPARDPLDNSAVVERQIHRIIIDGLIINRNTPCLTRYIGDYTCSPADVQFEDDDHKSVFDEFMESDPLVNILITQFGGSKTIRNYHTSLSTLIKITFMLGHTINCFTRLGLRHNDLHTGNILIDELSSPVTMKFKISATQSVQFETDVIPRIFDFDRGAISYPGIDRNIYLDSNGCDDYSSQCNEFSSRFDLFSLLYCVLSTLTGSFGESEIFRNRLNRVTGYESLARENDRLIRFPNLLAISLISKADSNLISVPSFLDLLVHDYKDIFPVVDDSRTDLLSYRSPPYRELVDVFPTIDTGTVPRTVPPSGDDIDTEIISASLKREYERFLNINTNQAFVMASDLVKYFLSTYSALLRNGSVIRYTTAKSRIDRTYNILSNAEILATTTFRNKNITKLNANQLRLYSICFLLMALPFFISIPKKSVNILIGSIIGVHPDFIGTVISDIWNANNNSLPISVPILE